jgi:hypothetical protein
MSDEELSLQEEVAAAFKETESENAEVHDTGVDSNEVAKDLPDADKARDDKGRFAPKKEEEVETPAVQEEPEKVTLTSEKAPSSWSPTVREKWTTLPEDVRSEIIRREEASAVGVRKLQEEMAPVRQLAENLTPFMQEAQQAGLDPHAYVQRTMQAERALRAQDPAQRFEALLSIADTYGIPLRQALGVQQQVPAQQPVQAQLPPQVAQELEAMRGWRAQQEQAAVEQQISQFSTDKEFFEDVRATMGDLIEAGKAKGLEDAYEQACWMSPEVRKVLIQREKAGGTQEAIRQRQEAAQRANLKTTSNVDVSSQTEEESDDIESIIRAQFAKSGRM